MSNFEFVFSLLVILLGLALAEVFGGLGRVLKERPPVHIGWATALLATWTVIRMVLFWRVIWRTRDTLPDTSASLLAGTLICGLYYVAGTLVFPNKLEGRTSLDDYFAQEKSKALGALLAATALAYALRPAVLGRASWSYMNWFDWTGIAIIFSAGPVAMLARRRGVAIAALAVLVGHDLLFSLARSLWSI